MPKRLTLAHHLDAEAARCERLASGVSDPDLIVRLHAWAREYRHDARRHHGSKQLWPS